MQPPFILAIDQGTTSSRALIVDAAGEVAGLGQQSFTQHFPQPGWVEHDPEEIWTTTVESIGIALAQAGLAVSELAAVGVTNQRETVVVWDRRTGEPLHNA
ncbi:MAG TPA: FGGY family carbohydrate kinase, partial [Tepidiformaceae bacterium]|nr:FGGY family carbohydrate kinase [Tepidiformaceae bacterium]